jgi:hypothetical protein
MLVKLYGAASESGQGSL